MSKPKAKTKKKLREERTQPHQKISQRESSKSRSPLKLGIDLVSQLMETGLIGISIVDRNGQIIYANTLSKRVFGLTKDKITQRAYNSLEWRITDYNGNPFPNEKLPFQIVKRTRKPVYNVRHAIERPDGERVLLSINAVPLLDKQGNFEGMIAAVDDVTKQINSARILQQERDRARAYLETANVMFVAIDANKKVTLINSKGLEILGYRAEEIIGRDWFVTFLPERFRDEVASVFERMMAGEIRPVEYFENPVMTRDGQERIIAWHSTILKDDKGRIIGTLSSGEDITDRKKAEEALRESEKKYRELVENINDVIYSTDEMGLLTYISPKVADVIGYAPSEMIGKNFLESVHPEDRPSIQKRFKELQSSDIRPSEYRALAKSKKLVWVRTFSQPQFEGDEFVGVKGVLTDITDRKKAEEKIAASLKEKEVMLREIHHRVKNNLQIISSLLRLQSKNITDEKLLDIFRASQGRIRSMALIHERLYQSEDLSRIDFSDYIKTLTLHLLTVSTKDPESIKLKIEIEDIQLTINQAIPCGLIINEFVSNSLKHAFPEGRKGEISIRMHKDETGKHIIIMKDNGIGFPEHVDLRSPQTLGLQIISDLVRQLEGTAELHRDRGTEFRIVF